MFFVSNLPCKGGEKYTGNILQTQHTSRVQPYAHYTGNPIMIFQMLLDCLNDLETSVSY